MAEFYVRGGLRMSRAEPVGAGGFPPEQLLDVAAHAGFPATMPVDERLAGAAGFLRLRDFSPMQALELRLDQVRHR